ncbi:hypothetical protein PN36_18860 [Candidatus Thiomargarita nelsonii]|uniref:Polymerase nucleotidyl transferase domain-containing protein n=1 Tax=Candidatus Thiomargarita nelsonii TaxID=1003181 RepID=A0A4E0QPD7_9GAMM|nr:hypothetical protein PN36_18860 [Candidatus Thiomargarita nelsonii]
MKRQQSPELRQTLAQEAARLMYEEGVDQYLNAKRIAAKRILGRTGGKNIRYRPQFLPSNGEIQAALREIVQFSEGEFSEQRLFAMRVIALETMLSLQQFSPRLIGSVSTGHVRRGSDIDLHVFSENIDEVERYLTELGWRFKTKEVTIRVGGEYRDYTHIYYMRVFPIELSVYSYDEIRVTQRSSTDGKPIVRLKASALERLIAEEHSREWELYLATSEISGLELFKVEDPR